MGGFYAKQQQQQQQTNKQNKKQSKNGNIVKGGKSGRLGDRQNDEKSLILGLQFKFPKTHEAQIGSPPETNMFEL